MCISKHIASNQTTSQRGCSGVCKNPNCKNRAANSDSKEISVPKKGDSNLETRETTIIGTEGVIQG